MNERNEFEVLALAVVEIKPVEIEFDFSIMSDEEFEEVYGASFSPSEIPLN